MNYSTFMQYVKERAKFRSDDAVKKTIETVLEVLGQKISGGQAEDVAKALPPQLRPYLSQTAEAAAFNRAEFLMKISGREGVDLATAEEHARAVLSVLADWIPSAELRDTLQRIPNDMRTLFVWIKKAA